MSRKVEPSFDAVATRTKAPVLANDLTDEETDVGEADPKHQTRRAPAERPAERRSREPRQAVHFDIDEGDGAGDGAGDDNGDQGCSTTSGLREGEEVEARYRGKARYYPGRISSVNRDGTYDIDYDDGEKEIGVREDLIKSLKATKPKKRAYVSSSNSSASRSSIIGCILVFVCARGQGQN